MSCVSYLTELHTSSTEVVDSAIVEVTTANNVATINTSTSKVAEVIPNNYTLSSGGLYSGYLNGNAPQWIADIIDVAISDYLATNYDAMLETYRTQIEDLALGVNQNIVSIQNSELSLNALVTSVKSELDGNIAGVLDVVATKVDDTSASALVRTLVGSKWLSENESIAESYIEQVATTKVQEGFAKNVVYNQLISSVNDTTTGLTGLATAKDLMFTKTGIDPVTGALGATSGYFQELYAEVGDNAASITAVENVAATAYTWSAEASKLITSPVGAITGWSFGDGTNTSSFFKISADKFSLVNANGTATPLVVNAADPNNVQMTFNGTVNFTNTNMTPYSNSVLAADLANPSGTTVINGGRITTGSITAGQINVGSVQAATVTASYINALNIVADSVDARWVYAGNINANNITAGTLNVDVINSGSLTSARGPVTVSFSKSGPSYGSTTLATITASNSSGSLNMLVLNIEAGLDHDTMDPSTFAQVVIMQDGVVKLRRSMPLFRIEVPTYLDIPYTTPGNNSVFTVAAVYNLAYRLDSNDRDTFSVTGSVSLIEFKK